MSVLCEPKGEFSSLFSLFSTATGAGNVFALTRKVCEAKWGVVTI